MTFRDATLNSFFFREFFPVRPFSLLVIIVAIISGFMNYYFLIACVENLMQPIHNRANSVLYFNNRPPDKLVLFKEKQLRQFDGVERPEMLLSILGIVYDVTKSNDYGPNSEYHSLIGADNSKAFLTWKFSKSDISDDILSLPRSQVVTIKYYSDFFEQTHKKIGKLVGRYYDSFGKLTPYGKQVRTILKLSEEEIPYEAAMKQLFPSCHVARDVKIGIIFWCSYVSDGVKRDWRGIPMELIIPGKESRCACIQESDVGKLTNVRDYPNCKEDEDIAHSKICHIKLEEKYKTAKIKLNEYEKSSHSYEIEDNDDNYLDLEDEDQKEELIDEELLVMVDGNEV